MTHELTPRKRLRALLAGGLALAGAFLFGLLAGPDGLASLATLAASLWSAPDPPSADALATALLGLRASRVLLALLVGASLASAGAVLQALMRNPLADPYIIGVSGGAALGGGLVLALGAASASLTVSLGALAGAGVASTGLALLLARAESIRPDAVLLAGVVFNSFAAAVLTLIKSLLPPDRAYALLHWLVGSIGYPQAEALGPLALVTVAGVGLLVAVSGSIELLSLGDREATRLGVAAGQVRALGYLASAGLVAFTVPLTGMIGFVGLIVPHALRLWVGSDQRLLIPLSALVGGAVLMGFDGVARLSFLWLGSELPVGALTAIVGAPLFGGVLLSKRAGSPS